MAINVRCHASKVSGVTIVAMSLNAAAEGLGSCRQSSALRVGEPQASGAKLFPENAVLVLEIVDDIALLLVHPTGERDENEPQRMGQRRHTHEGYQRLIQRRLLLPDLKADP